MRLLRWQLPFACLWLIMLFRSTRMVPRILLAAGGFVLLLWPHSGNSGNNGFRVGRTGTG